MGWEIWPCSTTTRTVDSHAAGENAGGRAVAELGWCNQFANILRWGQHWKRCHEDDLEAFGIDKEGWTAAVKEGEAIPWHQGVLRGAEKFMISWHEKQEGESHKRAIDRDKKEQQGNKETTTKPGGG